jgi:predicted nuclease of predicted toxin-antitoxin system
MTAIRLYLDENVHPFIADALRRRGWQATTTVEVGRRGATDADQLAFATEQGSTLMTYNVGHFARLHYELVARGETHAGIVLATQADPRRNLRSLLNLISSVTAEAIRGYLVYLNNWG